MTQNPRKKAFFSFFLEQSLGNTTTSARLKWGLSKVPGFNAQFHELDPFEQPHGLLERLFRRNWTLLLGLKAIGKIYSDKKNGRSPSGLYFFTQVGGMLPLLLIRDIPIILAMDATPEQIDTMAVHYAHQASKFTWIEKFKKLIISRLLKKSAHIIALTEWCKKSLIDSYGLANTHVSVIYPGVDLKVWKPLGSKDENPEKLKILFVGNDFERKGGKLLLKVFTTHLTKKAELHIVSQKFKPSSPLPGVHVFSGLNSSSPELIAKYEECHIFAFPTQADTLGLALIEAMAMGLAVIATQVGGVPEIARHNQEGLMIPPNDEEALLQALNALIESPELRQKLGQSARRRTHEKFDQEKNAALVAETLISLVRAGSS